MILLRFCRIIFNQTMKFFENIAEKLIWQLICFIYFDCIIYMLDLFQLELRSSRNLGGCNKVEDDPDFQR